MTGTIAAVSTGAAVSAIGIVRLSGAEAINAADRLFVPASGSKMSERPDRSLVYGKLYRLNGDLLDLCMCTVSRGPNSYTGEDSAEFQCHGSPIVLRTLLEELFSLGIRQAKAGEFTKRAFLNGRMELTAAEAVADLIDAESAEEACNAVGQISGAISRRTDTIYSALTDICSHYHAVLDYPDEDIEPFVIEKYRSDLEQSVSVLESLLKTFSRGKLMKSGVPAVIVGRPNAGKSSLLNALLGYDRAIVTDIPGTTRDTIEEKLRLGGVTLRLTDTAGIRDSADAAEKLGVERSRTAMRDADLVIVVIDGSAPVTSEDYEIISAASCAPHAVIAASKCDLGRADLPEFILPAVEISSVTGEGLDKLEQIVAEMYPLPETPSGEILTNPRQAEAVSSARDYLKAAISAIDDCATPDIVLTEAEGAMNAIGELSGRTVREDVTNRIFERFCVGK